MAGLVALIASGAFVFVGGLFGYCAVRLGAKFDAVDLEAFGDVPRIPNEGDCPWRE